MAKFSFPDFSRKMPSLLIETLVVSFVVGFAIMWTKLMNESVFAIQGVVLILLAALVKFLYVRSDRRVDSQQIPLKSVEKLDYAITMAKARYVRDRERISKKIKDQPDSKDSVLTRRSNYEFLASNKLANNLWKAFFLAAVVLFLVAGYLSEISIIRHYGQLAYLGILLFVAYIGAFLGFLHFIRRPRVSVSRVFDAYINLGALLFGIPFGIFFIFLISTAILLVFVSPSGDPKIVVLSTLLVAVLVTVILQVGYIIHSIKKFASERELSVFAYIKMKLSPEERERERREKRAHLERIDSFYEKIPEIKRRIHPRANVLKEPYPVLDIDEDYQDSKKGGAFRTLLREFAVPILGIFVADMLLIAAFFALASFGGF